MQLYFLESYTKKKRFNILKEFKPLILSSIFHIIIILIVIYIKLSIEELPVEVTYNIEILSQSQADKLIQDEKNRTIEEGDEFAEDDIIDEAIKSDIIVVNKSLKPESKTSLKNKTKKTKKKTFEDQLAMMPETVRNQIKDLYSNHDYDKLITVWFEQYKILALKSSLQKNDVYALLRVRINKLGEIIYYKIEESTGVTELDKAIMEMTSQANPAPPIPDEYTADKIVEFILPIILYKY